MSSTQAMRILIVDDHEAMRHGLAALFLPESDMEVCGQVDSPDEALAEISRVEPDVVLVDVSLKGANGIELVRHLKKVRPETVVIVLSMHDESRYGQIARDAGAAAYIHKAELLDRLIPTLRGCKSMAESVDSSSNSATPHSSRAHRHRA
jgi:DNA-binding NarL/FixJ family response regulator